MAHDQHHSTAEGTHDHGVGHVVPARILILTAVGLLILTYATVRLAGFDFGAGNIYVALAIAVTKASLVCLFFMHLRWDRPFNAIVFIASIFLVSVFIGGAMTDTFEYGGEVIKANAPKVDLKLQELKP